MNIAWFELDEPLPDIRAPSRAGVVFGLSLVSGVVSSVAFTAGGSYGFWFLPGVFFGLLVLLPWCLWCRFAPAQTVLCVALAPLGYMVAVMAFFAFPLSGGLGCAMTLAPAWIDTHRKVRQAVAWAVFAGTLLGVGFWCADSYPAGVFVWQAGVGLCLSLALTRDD